MKNKKSNNELSKSILANFSHKEKKKIITKMEISIRIEEARNNRGWTKLELADRFGKKPSVITKWLSGSHNFTIDTLVEIEDLLKIKILPLEEMKPEINAQYTGVIEEQTSDLDTMSDFCNMMAATTGTLLYRKQVDKVVSK